MCCTHSIERALTALGLIAAAATLSSSQPAPFGPTRVEAALRTSGLTILPDIATKLPPGELMDYGFEGLHGEYVSATVVIYPSARKARQEAVAFQNGRAKFGAITRATQTLRVRNVVLLRGRRVTKRQWHALNRALGRLGRPVSP